MSEIDKEIKFIQTAIEAGRGGLGDLGKALLALKKAAMINRMSDLDDIEIDTPLPDQVIKYDGDAGIWTNGPAVAGEGDFQPQDPTLTALAALDPSEGVLYQGGLDIFSKRAIGTATDTISAGDHNHSGTYSLAAHNHDATYSPLAHNHTATYAPITHYHDDIYANLSHNHDASYSALAHLHDATYINVVVSAVNGNIPVLNATGKLVDSGYSIAGILTDVPTLHDLPDVTLTTPIDGHVLKYDSGTSQWINGTVVAGEGTFQLADNTLTALAALDTNAGVLYQTGSDAFEKRVLGTTTGTISSGDHTHTGVYSPVGHDHAGVYSVTAHDHAATYAPIVHTHTGYVDTTRLVATQHSLTGGGDLSANRTMNLVGDVASPGVNKVYATDVTGARVWRDGLFTANIPAGLTTVQTITALRAVASPTDGMAIFMRNHTAIGDGGGGLFCFDTALVQTRMVNSITIASGGSGYQANTLLRVTGGTAVSGQVARILITAVTSGAVTSVLLIDKGNYTVDPSSAAVATTCAFGTGCTLNLTLTKYDNDGTLIAPPGTTGMWKRNVDTWEVNVRWFGAKGWFTGDESRKIQNAINTVGGGGVILLPQGQWIISNTLYLNQSQTLKGYSTDAGGSMLWHANATSPLIKSNDSVAEADKKRVRIVDLNIGSSASLSCIKLLATTEALIENVTFTGAPTEDHIYLSNCWGTRITKCRFFGSARSHINIDRPSGHLGNHALTIDSMYTSANAQYGIWCHSDDTALSVAGLNITNCTVQGADVAQVAIYGASAVNITGLYTELGPRPVILGDRATSRLVSGANISGCSFMTYGNGFPMMLSFCVDVAIVGCDLNANGNQTDWIHYDYARNVTIMGCTPTEMYSGIRRTAGSIYGPTVIRGQGLTHAATFTMKSTGAVNQFFHMSINSSGAWTATEWIPTSL